MSEKRQPSARMTSAFRAASVAGYSPQQPAMPRWSGWPRRQRALAHEGRVDGDVHVLGERRELGRRVREDDAAACEHERAPRRQQEVERPLHGLRRAGCPPVEHRGALLGLRHVNVGLPDPEVVGDVDVHRAGPAGAGQLEGLGQELPEILDRMGLVAALGDHLRDAREVRLVVAVLLLQRPGVVLVGCDLARDPDERRRVVERVRHRDREQHRPRARGRVHGDHLPGGPEVGIGHIAGAGLDPREDDLDLVLAVVDAVEQADGAVARVAEQVRHLLPDQVLDDEVASAHLGHRFLLRSRRRRRPRPRPGHHRPRRAPGCSAAGIERAQTTCYVPARVG